MPWPVNAFKMLLDAVREKSLWKQYQQYCKQNQFIKTGGYDKWFTASLAGSVTVRPRLTCTAPDGTGCAADDSGALEAAAEMDEVCSPAEDLWLKLKVERFPAGGLSCRGGGRRAAGFNGSAARWKPPVPAACRGCRCTCRRRKTLGTRRVVWSCSGSAVSLVWNGHLILGATLALISPVSGLVTSLKLFSLNQREIEISWSKEITYLIASKLCFLKGSVC